MEIQFERESLFKEVWETPMRTLATKYGLSDNGLRDICHALAIPVPPRGHWAKKAAGHTVFAPPLPPTTGSTGYTFRIIQQARLLPPNEELVAWLSERLAFEANSANKIIVEPELKHAHPLVRQTEKVLDEYRRKLDASKKRAESPSKPRNPSQPDLSAFSRPSWREYLSKGHIELPSETLPLRVSLEMADRALRLWDALIKGCIHRNMEVSLGKNRLIVLERGVKLELRISERLERSTLPTNGMTDLDILFKRNVLHESTGELRIFVDGYGTEWKVVDDQKGKVEEKLNVVLSRIHSEVKLRLDTEAERTERRRLERVQEEKRELERKIQAEHKKLEEQERQRIAALVAEAENWKRTSLVREYIEAIKKYASETYLSPEGKRTLDEWLTWAEHAANEMDPIKNRLPKIC